MLNKSKNKYVTNWDDVPVVIDLPYVAHLLGCSRENARRMCQRGDIKAFKVGDMWRVRKEAVFEYMEKGVNQ